MIDYFKSFLQLYLSKTRNRIEVKVDYFYSSNIFLMTQYSNNIIC